MITFRTATLVELETVLDWAAAEGWNPGIDDPVAFFAADPDGFFVACDGNQPVAAISVVNHTECFAFLGLYIVLPSHRGKGIGYQLWQHALRHAGDRTVGLDGVPDQQENYRASGFTHAGATTRYTGTIAAKLDAKTRMATSDDVPDLIAQEAAASGVGKTGYLEGWFEQTETRKTFVTEGGFCTVRTCRSGGKIGPLKATDVVVAERLIRHAATFVTGEISIDVPDASKTLSGLCEALGLIAGFHTARMYRGPFECPSVDGFAVATLELG